MSTHNKEIKKYLLYILGLLLAFIAALVGLDKINSSLDADINRAKDSYEHDVKEAQEAEELLKQTTTP